MHHREPTPVCAAKQISHMPKQLKVLLPGSIGNCSNILPFVWLEISQGTHSRSAERFPSSPLPAGGRYFCRWLCGLMMNYVEHEKRGALLMMRCLLCLMAGIDLNWTELNRNEVSCWVLVWELGWFANRSRTRGILMKEEVENKQRCAQIVFEKI